MYFVVGDHLQLFTNFICAGVNGEPCTNRPKEIDSEDGAVDVHSQALALHHSILWDTFASTSDKYFVEPLMASVMLEK